MGTYFDSIAPYFCANCGEKINFHNKYARQDWMAGASHNCSCGAHFIHLPNEEVPNKQRKELDYYL
ncbi:hypothetical protein [Marininema halotolerans]|uniref:Uncharacterized protein n=1 Tax=Marininema halotolerans TaxID=1155944 RepID=A0A1I6UQN7_9BACL|nr:hypothetical protein [Marininema halotolerans]SFT03738.1 hypothetical protein SAMN05444972_11910 [Marininema halotolerans]